jgi:hypothetical protein
MTNASQVFPASLQPKLSPPSCKHHSSPSPSTCYTTAFVPPAWACPPPTCKSGAHAPFSTSSTHPMTCYPNSPMPSPFQVLATGRGTGGSHNCLLAPPARASCTWAATPHSPMCKPRASTCSLSPPAPSLMYATSPLPLCVPRLTSMTCALH